MPPLHPPQLKYYFSYAEFHENHSHKINYFEHLLSRLLYMLRENCRKWGKKIIFGF